MGSIDPTFNPTPEPTQDRDELFETLCERPHCCEGDWEAFVGYIEDRHRHYGYFAPQQFENCDEATDAIRDAVAESAESALDSLYVDEIVDQVYWQICKQNACSLDVTTEKLSNHSNDTSDDTVLQDIGGSVPQTVWPQVAARSLLRTPSPTEFHQESAFVWFWQPMSSMDLLRLFGILVVFVSCCLTVRGCLQSDRDYRNPSVSGDRMKDVIHDSDDCTDSECDLEQPMNEENRKFLVQELPVNDY